MLVNSTSFIFSLSLPEILPKKIICSLYSLGKYDIVYVCSF